MTDFSTDTFHTSKIEKPKSEKSICTAALTKKKKSPFEAAIVVSVLITVAFNLSAVHICR